MVKCTSRERGIGNYTLTSFAAPGSSESHSSRPYLVLKGMKQLRPTEFSGGYRLEANTVLKLGKIRLVVRELRCPSGIAEKPAMLSSPHPESVKGEISPTERECRICRCSEGSEANPLLSPCNCAGSIRYIHAECMRTWYESKTTCYRSAQVSSYIVRGLECELCKCKYSVSFEQNGKSFDLISILRPKDVPYIVLESLSPEQFKQIHIASFAPNSSLSIVLTPSCDQTNRDDRSPATS